MNRKNIYMTREMMEKLKELAKKNGLDFTSYTRFLITTGPKKIKPCGIEYGSGIMVKIGCPDNCTLNSDQCRGVFYGAITMK